MVVDFAGSDAPYKDADLAKNKGGDVLYFPILLGAITVSLQPRRRRQAAAVAGDDREDLPARHQEVERPGIAADNPGAKLPDADIVVAHRSDGSGTTENFTKYLDTGRDAACGSSRAARPSSGPPTPRPATATPASRRS